MAARKRVANWRAAHDLAVNRIAALMAQGEKDKQQIERLMEKLKMADEDRKALMMMHDEERMRLRLRAESLEMALKSYGERLALQEAVTYYTEKFERRSIAPRHPGPEAYSTYSAKMASTEPALHTYKDKE